MPFSVSRTPNVTPLMICWGNFPIGMFLPSTLSVAMFVVSTSQSLMVASPLEIAFAKSRQESYPQCLQFSPGRLLRIELANISFNAEITSSKLYTGGFGNFA